MLRPDEKGFPSDEGAADYESSRAQLERILVQLQLVEVLYLRLIGLRTRRLAQPELEAELIHESRKLETELRAAQDELEALACRLRPEGSLGSTRAGF